MAVFQQESDYIDYLWQEWETKFPPNPARAIPEWTLGILLFMIAPTAASDLNLTLAPYCASFLAVILVNNLIVFLTLRKSARGIKKGSDQYRARLIAYYEGLAVMMISLSLIGLSASLIILERINDSVGPYPTLITVAGYVALGIFVLVRTPSYIKKRASGGPVTGESQSLVWGRVLQSVIIGSAILLANILGRSGDSAELWLLGGLSLLGAFLLLPIGMAILSQVLTLITAHRVATRRS